MTWKKGEEAKARLALPSLPICVSLLPLLQWTCMTSLSNRYRKEAKHQRASTTYLPLLWTALTKRQRFEAAGFLKTQTKIQTTWICNGVISLPHIPTASYSTLRFWSQRLSQNLLASKGIKVCYSQWKETCPSVSFAALPLITNTTWHAFEIRLINSTS